MNLKPLKTVPLKLLNVGNLKDAVTESFLETFLDESMVVSVVEKNNKNEFKKGLSLNITNSLISRTRRLELENKIQYMLDNPKDYNIFVTLTHEKYVEISNINRDMNDYDLSLSDFKVAKGIKEEDLKKYESIKDKEEKSNLFYDYYEYRGFCEDIYGKTFYADEDWVDFGDAGDEINLGLILNINDNSEIEFYPCYSGQLNMCGSGYVLIEDLGSFKEIAINFIRDITSEIRLPPIQIIPLKSLNVEKLESIRQEAFQNTELNPDTIVSVVEEIKKDWYDYFIPINNTLSDETDELPTDKKVEYLASNPKTHNIFIHLIHQKQIECSDINSDLEECNLTLEAFKVMNNITKEELKEYENIEDEEEKSEVFYDYYEYRGFCEDIYNNTFYADEESVDFGDANDKMMGLILHINDNNELEIYGGSFEQWGMNSGGYNLIEDLGSFKDITLKFIKDITN